MSFRTASALKRGLFLIEPSFVHRNLNTVADLYLGKPVDFGFNERQEDELLKDMPVTPFTTLHPAEHAANATYNATQVYNVGYYTRLDDIPQGSIAVVNLFGPVLKYGDMCSYGMVDKAQLLQRLAASGKFKSIILNIDSPGGQADGTQLLADAIINIRATYGIKFIAVVDDGMMASAAMWIGSACDEIFATKTTDTFGSIGVYTSLYDFTEYLAKLGVKIEDIYSDYSFDKNGAYRKALAGDQSGMKESLNFLAEAFHQAVITNRGDRLTLSEIKDDKGNIIGREPLTGKMYTAQVAVDMGLIDGILPFDEILLRADGAGDNNQSFNPNQNTMFGNKFKNLSAMKGKKAEEVTQTQVDAANQEIVSEGIEHVSLALDSELTTAATAVTENGSVLAAINAVLGEGNHKPTLTEAFNVFAAAASKTATNLTAMTTECNNWKNKAVEYGAKDAAEPTATQQVATDDIPATGGKNAFYSEADAELAELRNKAGYQVKTK